MNNSTNVLIKTERWSTFFDKQFLNSGIFCVFLTVQSSVGIVPTIMLWMFQHISLVYLCPFCNWTLLSIHLLKIQVILNVMSCRLGIVYHSGNCFLICIALYPRRCESMSAPFWKPLNLCVCMHARTHAMCARAHMQTSQCYPQFAHSSH